MATAHALPFDEPVWQVECEIEEMRMSAGDRTHDAKALRELERKRDRIIESVYAKLTPWQQVQVARHPERPSTLDYARLMLDGFIELHGDRRFGDDRAIVTGLGKLAGRRIMLIGHQKGRDTREKLRCNFGMPHPEGYRKALRAMKLAEKYHLPSICLIDTPGAYPGIGAEERGEAEAIAENLFEMARLRSPIISVVTGEGCSGGAIGIGLANHAAMLQFAYYAVISPEGCAAILWRTGEKAPVAAQAMRLTGKDLLKLRLIDNVVPEPPGGAHRAPDLMAANLKAALVEAIDALAPLSAEQLVEQRCGKYRHVGVFFEGREKVDLSRKAAAGAPAESGRKARARRTPSAAAKS